MNRAFNELAALASLSYQMKYITNATPDEYVLPDEMLDAACSAIESTLKSEVLRKSLTDNERNVLLELVKDFRQIEQLLDWTTFDRNSFV